MTTYDLNPFGEINTKFLDECYNGEIQFQSRSLRLDLNFEKNKVAENKLDIIKSMIENIEQLDLQNRKYIQDDYNNVDGDITKGYIGFHLNELDKDQLASLIDMDVDIVEKGEALLNKLYLYRVGFYPECKEHFAVFDYTIGKDFTDYIVVINVDIKGKIHCMTQES